MFKLYMLFAGWEVRIVKICDRGLENTAGEAVFSNPKLSVVANARNQTFSVTKIE